MSRPSLTIGIEEEYQTIDPETRDLRSHIQAEIIEKAAGACVREYECTGDIGGEMGTREAGDAVCRRIQSLAQGARDPYEL